MCKDVQRTSNLRECTHGVSLPFTCKTRTLRFTGKCGDIIQVRWETLTSLDVKYNQKNMYKTLSEWATFCERYDKGSQLKLVQLQNANA